MVELLVPITMFFVLIGGVQRTINHVGTWGINSIPGIRQSLSEEPGERLCLGVSQSLFADARNDLHQGDAEPGPALIIEGDISNRLTGQSIESFNYRILLGPGVASFELCSSRTLQASDAHQGESHGERA